MHRQVGGQYGGIAGEGFDQRQGEPLRQARHQQGPAMAVEPGQLGIVGVKRVHTVLKPQLPQLLSLPAIEGSAPSQHQIVGEPGMDAVKHFSVFVAASSAHVEVEGTPWNTGAGLGGQVEEGAAQVDHPDPFPEGRDPLDQVGGTAGADANDRGAGLQPGSFLYPVGTAPQGGQLRQLLRGHVMQGGDQRAGQSRRRQAEVIGGMEEVESSGVGGQGRRIKPESPQKGEQGEGQPHQIRAPQVSIAVQPEWQHGGKSRLHRIPPPGQTADQVGKAAADAAPGHQAEDLMIEADA